MATVKEVENKLGPLAQLHELSQSTEERLTALNALAEHVSHKAKALESQQQSVEHAVVQANRVNEMVWAMDVQIGKLNEGMKQVARAEETLGAHREADRRRPTRSSRPPPRLRQQIPSARPQAEEGGRRAARRRPRPGRHAGDQEEGVRGVRRARCARCRPAVGDAESRMEALAAKDKNLHRADAEDRRHDQALRGAVRSVRRPDQEAARARVAQRAARPGRRARQEDVVADGLAAPEPRRTSTSLRKEVQEFYKSHAEVAQAARQARRRSRRRSRRSASA